MELNRFRGYAEAYAQKAGMLHQQLPHSPAEAQRLAEVRRVFRSLEKTQQLRSELSMEHKDAQRSEAQAAVERQRYQDRSSQVRAELLEAQKHLTMLRDQRSTTMHLLGEREHERRELLHSHTGLALEFERLKFELSSGGDARGSVQSPSASNLPCKTASDLNLVSAANVASHAGSGRNRRPL